ncbi:hypothetical protein OBBRIDRAFT_791770 [Obba rivulosa]|uniref:F-box domain-containing protein n=1 Tax=Obba rivulosa TaxID=1052685 RepID=A0A8E2AVQ8_9APHY|nr:hypothetical protein OBBRIDRAFT_791770 [Obba rivulosa]
MFESSSMKSGEARIPPLNLDILREVMSFLSNKDILRMMRICHDLLPTGARLLLQRDLRLIDVHCDKKLSSFCQFMLRDSPNRFVFLQELNLYLLDPPALSPETLNLFILVLRQAHHIRSLTLSFRDGVLEECPHLTTAIASMTSIRKLYWFSQSSFPPPCGPRGAKMIASMSSPLEGVSVSFDACDSSQDLAKVFGTFSPTLNYLQVRNCEIRRSPIQFAQLSYLYASTAFPVEMEILTNMFPNLRKLRLSLRRGWGAFKREWRSIRSRNLRVQPSACTSLQSIRGHALALWSLGFQSEVPRLTLSLFDHKDLEYFQTILSDIHPSDVDVHISLGELCLNDLDTLLQGMTDVETLCIGLIFTEDVDTQHLSMIASEVLRILENTSISCLRLRLKRPYKGRFREEAYWDPIVKYFKHGLDIAAFAQQATRALPALTNMTLYVEWCSESEWEVQRSAVGDATVKQTSWRELN